MTEAIQSERNSGSPRGAQAETVRLSATGPAAGILIISAIRSVKISREQRIANDDQRTTNDQRPTTVPQTATRFCAMLRLRRSEARLPESLRHSESDAVHPCAIPAYKRTRMPPRLRAEGTTTSGTAVAAPVAGCAVRSVPPPAPGTAGGYE